jgi:hypothetical protein
MIKELKMKPVDLAKNGSNAGFHGSRHEGGFSICQSSGGRQSTSDGKSLGQCDLGHRSPLAIAEVRLLYLELRIRPEPCLSHAPRRPSQFCQCSSNFRIPFNGKVKKLVAICRPQRKGENAKGWYQSQSASSHDFFV